MAQINFLLLPKLLEHPIVPNLPKQIQRVDDLLVQLNYPNPFSTSTQFVFTLTGRELPNYMKIQILTVSGKVVREILQEELGTLRIGINRTEYAWDGKDEYGDQLANGVYLYRVITKRDGADYEIYGNRNDFMFRQGFGKMYLMR